ncbi:hypothetical protein L1887_26720 [Cichorium endivia]|nr:hypothetical protein L1887_26720 [Cichorium endivia]
MLQILGAWFEIAFGVADTKSLKWRRSTPDEIVAHQPGSCPVIRSNLFTASHMSSHFTNIIINIKLTTDTKINVNIECSLRKKESQV